MFYLFGQELDARIVPDVDLSIENLYYGNENEILSKLFWLNDEETVALRYLNSRPKDIVLMGANNLLIDSLSVNKMFLSNYSYGSEKFISINAFIRQSSNSFILVHNSGSTLVETVNGKFKVKEKKISPGKPNLPDSLLNEHEIIHLDRLSIGYKVDPSKYIDSPDYWVYDWKKGSHVIYEDSKFEEVSKNRYWNKKANPELTISTYSHFVYYISKTKDGLLFNLPQKNRFVLYNTETSKMQGYTFPDLNNKKNAWYTFYDWELDRFYAVYDEGKNYNIYSIDEEMKGYYKLMTSEAQPLGVIDGKVYFYELTMKKKKSGFYFDHYLVNLYPKLK
ncbi:hypothetical protein PBT90_03930 [Algoriphagus halophytocola]|uniref:hypothetical protein n=1 Tax=Algoriphagus halophytocola TaxID=2991499 RepID=UPI0022DE1BAD|nr:hypothetical protein [Algoriphagus sp. TR-M9]WBL43834.1 hypothetical protein PBT90_03930 [Algoriphagus sp. TR-M9]